MELFKQGLVELVNGQYEEAIRKFSIALVDNPNDAIIYYYRGKAWTQIGAPVSAEHDFMMANKLNPNINIPQKHTSSEEKHSKYTLFKFLKKQKN